MKNYLTFIKEGNHKLNTELWIGDKVVVHNSSPENEFLNGKRGTIIKVRKFNTEELFYSIDFDDEIENGHSCNGAGRDKHCFTLKYWDVKKIDDIDPIKEEDIEWF
jgi:hypothetical protein